MMPDVSGIIKGSQTLSFLDELSPFLDSRVSTLSSLMKHHQAQSHDASASNEQIVPPCVLFWHKSPHE